MAVVGSNGLAGTMPPHCGQIALGFFFATLGLNVARDIVPPKIRRFMPVPMAIGEKHIYIVTITYRGAALLICFPQSKRLHALELPDGR